MGTDRSHFHPLLFVVPALLCFHESAWTLPHQDPPLLQRSDIRYLGSFNVPTGDAVGCISGTGQHCFSYGGVFGFNPANQSLLMRGHAWVVGVGEVTIPATLGKSSTAVVLQDIHDISDGAPVDPGESNGQGPWAMLAYNGRWIVSGSTYYDADYTQVNTHGVSGSNLSLPSDFQGWYRFDPTVIANPRSIGGYMTTIPEEWQAALGGPALTGHCCLSIISASSSGPSVSVFDPDDVGVKNPIPGTTLLYYPTDKPLSPNSSQSNLFNLTTKMSGIAFPAGSGSVLFFGHQGTGPYCYGEGSECNDPCDASKGTHAAPYRHQVWAYDAKELLLVKTGGKKPWEIQPYAVWALEEIDAGGCAKMTGASYDPATGKLYISENFADRPAVHVYQISTSTTGIRGKMAVGKAPNDLRISANPFGRGIHIEGSLPHSAATALQGRIRDLQGNHIASFSLTADSPTRFSAYWDGMGEMGPAPRGTYILSIHAGANSRQAKMFLLRSPATP